MYCINVYILLLLLFIKYVYYVSMCTVYTHTNIHVVSCGSCGKPNNEQEMLKVHTMNTNHQPIFSKIGDGFHVIICMYIYILCLICILFTDHGIL